MNHAFVSSGISRTLVVLALSVSLLSFVNGGFERGLAASLAAALSVANWFALRWLGSRIANAQGSQRLTLSLLAVGKIALLMAIVFVLVKTLRLDPIGLCLGLSVLFLGPTLGGLLAGAGKPANPSAASAAHEES
jgi:hypothetical protein